MKKIVLDAGHGGSDPGTIANGIIEKDLTLKLTNYIHDRLNELDIPNEVTRNDDITLEPSVRTKKVQSFYGNGNDVIVVSNHINAGRGDGAEIIYALRNNDILSSKIAKELEMAGQNVRKYYQRRLPSKPSKDYYYILRDTPNNETIIVEYGFADSSGDDVNILKNDWQKLAEAVTKAITEYAGGNYIAPIESNYYTVLKGDTLWNIAKKFNISVDELKNANNLVSNLISVNQNLIIPTNNSSNEYIVQKGDTLYSIAKKYNTSVDNLKSINNQITDNISIGQFLKTSIPNNKIYTVLKGDNLYNIAKKYNTTVATLKELNNLETDILSINQKLLIP